MSIAVAIEDLAATSTAFGDAAFVVTTGDDGRAHVSHVRVSVGDGRIVAPVGPRSVANAVARPLVAVLWPPHEPGGFSLIVDATADAPTAAAAGGLVLVPTKAVLHRPA